MKYHGLGHCSLTGRASLDAAAAQQRYVGRTQFNPMPIHRDEAISRLATTGLTDLTVAERAELIDTMLREDWSDTPGWNAVPPDVRDEFGLGERRHAASSSRYDEVLRIWLRHSFVGSTNAYLEQRLRVAGCDVTEVFGDEDQLVACPCCGRASLTESGGYDICKVCWWEDDGQDNNQADHGSGPNHLTLTQARANYLAHGIFDPRREDLRAHQEPADKYAVARTFTLSSNRDEVMETQSRWVSRAFDW